MEGEARQQSAQFEVLEYTVLGTKLSSALSSVEREKQQLFFWLKTQLPHSYKYLLDRRKPDNQKQKVLLIENYNQDDWVPKDDGLKLKLDDHHNNQRPHRNQKARIQSLTRSQHN